MQKYFGECCLLIVSLIAAAGWFFSKYAILELPSVGFIGIRFLIAALLFLPFACRHLRRMSGRQMLRAGAVGSVFTLNLCFWISAITYSDEFGAGAFLVSLSMLIAPLMAWLIFGQRPSRFFWLALPPAMAGLYLLSGYQSAFRFSLGNTLFLLTALSAAAYFVLNSQFAKQIDPLPLTTVQLFVVGLCGCLYSLSFETWPETVSVSTVGWVCASILIATNFRYLLQTIGQKHCNITSAAVIMILEPVWTLLLSVFILDENLTVAKITGCLLILSSLLIYRLQTLLRRKRR